MKTCTYCKQTKEVSAFAKDKHAKDGFTYACKECRNFRAKQHP